MDDGKTAMVPPALASIEADTVALGFDMPSERKTGALLCTLAASCPNSDLLELGTGTGLATAWLLHGMDKASSLISVDNDKKKRVTLHCATLVTMAVCDLSSKMQTNGWRTIRTVQSV